MIFFTPQNKYDLLIVSFPGRMWGEILALRDCDAFGKWENFCLSVCSVLSAVVSSILSQDLRLGPRFVNVWHDLKQRVALLAPNSFFFSNNNNNNNTTLMHLNYPGKHF